MDERKQDAMSESMLRALMEEHENEQQIEREIRRVKKTNSTFETLANRIIKDAQNGQSHRSVASSVLSNIGVGVTPKQNNPNPLRHVGQRAKKDRKSVV